MNPNGVDIDEILSGIQTEVHARKASPNAHPRLPAAPPRLSPIQAAAVESKKSVEEMTLEDLLSLRDVEFIYAAYRRVLRRDPDAVGLPVHLGYLRSGRFSKLDILVFLQFSDEGRRSGIRMPELNRAHWARRIKSVPVVGRLIESAYGLWRLPVLLKNVASQEAYIDSQLSDIRNDIAELAAKVELGYQRTAEVVNKQKLDYRILEGTLQKLSVSFNELHRSKADQAGMEKIIAELQHHLARLEFAKANRKELVSFEERFNKILPLKANQAELEALAEQAINREDLEALVRQVDTKAAREEVNALAAKLEARSTREDLAALVGKVDTKATREEVNALAAHVQDRARREDLAVLVRQLDTKATREEIGALSTQLEDRARREDVAALARQVETKAAREKVVELSERVDTLASRETIAELGGQVEELKASKADQAQISVIDGRLSQCENFRVDPSTVALLGQNVQSIANQVALYGQNLRDQQGRVNIFLELARRRMPEAFTPEEVTQLVSEQSHCLDSLYVAFEDRFRGSRESVREGTKVYLPYLKEALENTKRNRPLLDLACGRGEWLELLQNRGYPAKGVDINRTALQQCRELGLDVTEGDATEYLRKQPKNAFAAITCFHYVEHIEFPSLVALLDEVLRVLEPGGVVIFETPNARNILVSSGDFYRDPTHKNPVFPETLESIAELRGFAESTAYCFNETRTELIPLSKYRFDDLNDYVRISRDLAWIGVKAS